VAPESVLAEKLRDIDAALARGRADLDIAGREQRRSGRLVVAEIRMELPEPAFRAFVLRLFQRHRLQLITKPRQRRTTIYVLAPDVFAAEVLEPELQKLERAISDFVTACVERAVSGVFGEAEAGEPSTSSDDTSAEGA
jgi:hypothetical protein